MLQQEIDRVIPRYLEGIEPGMSAYDVALRIHTRLIAAVDYDSIALARQKKEEGANDDRIAQSAAENNGTFFTFKCANRALYEDALDRLCAQKKDCLTAVQAAAKANNKIQGNSYSYRYDKNLWTITVYFRYQ